MPGPDQTSEKPSARSTFPCPARALAVDVPLPLRRDLRLAHTRLDDQTAVLHCSRGDVVREPHAFDLLLGLERARRSKEWRRIDDVAELGEPRGCERRRLTDHAVGRLRPERELEADAVVLTRGLLRELEDARGRRSRIPLVVALEHANVARPGRARRILLRRLETDEHRLAFAREHARVVPLHPPEVREVEDVVGRADDERVELAARP